VAIEANVLLANMVSPVIQTKSDPAKKPDSLMFCGVCRLESTAGKAVDQARETTPGGATAHTTGLVTGDGGG
jgi:hypothetical protein